jgi:hypothetical protein
MSKFAQPDKQTNGLHTGNAKNLISLYRFPDTPAVYNTIGYMSSIGSICWVKYCIIRKLFTMAKKQILPALILFLLCLTTLVSYFRFQKYQPKTVKQLQEVKGYKTPDGNSLNLPYPTDALNIAISNTSDTEQVTFESAKQMVELHAFYKNIMLSKKWKQISEGIFTDYITSKYENDSKSVTIIIFNQPSIYKTFTSIEINHE